MTPDYIITRYALAIINGKPEQFDAIEVRGVTKVQTGADSFGYVATPEDLEPNEWLVGLHYVDESIGGCDGVGEFTRKEDAMAYAQELSLAFNWPINE